MLFEMPRLLEIMKSAINAEEDPKAGKEFLMYDWSTHHGLFTLCARLHRNPSSEQSDARYHLRNRLWVQSRFFA